MKIIADLHIHSKYSRATSGTADLENYHAAAIQKGINLMSTGDFTHPAWMRELKEKLIPASQGTYRLKQTSPGPDIRFILGTELSCIYKKAGRTRKSHHLVFMPDFKSAESFCAKLEGRFNLASDGRPILGLDAKNLLEEVLETSEDAFMIPAHIWTPWFSVLGSKSGFDTMEECFEEMTPHIFAAETGLSSDPAMNRLVPGLDNMTMVSFSDAHSPGKLGREASVFETDFTYRGILSAIKKGTPDIFPLTLEFYPELGKYHWDGHRKCGISMHPETTRSMKGICPKCRKPLTIGVLSRVLELSERKHAAPSKNSYISLVPMDQILSGLLGVGPATKKVSRALSAIREILGPDLFVLMDMPLDEIERKSPVPHLSRIIEAMRTGDLAITPGSDGDYGKPAGILP